MPQISNQLRATVNARIHGWNMRVGKGTILAIIWGTKFAGIDQTRSGMVIRQTQYGQDAKPFSVNEHLTKVKFLGKDLAI